MTDTILRTKLYIPPVRPELVSRPRLLERLDGGLGHKLTLVSAPAGFGKTTLLSEWVGQVDLPVAWVSLDEEDNDPARFLAYVISSLKTIPALGQAEVGETALALLQTPQPPLDAVLTSLINDIARVLDDPPKNLFTKPGYTLILVLDDYHVIEAQPIDDTLAFLLERLPPPPRGMHLIVAGRADPSLSLSRLRAGGQLTEVRVDDLRFAHDEVATFLSQVTGLQFTDENVTALEARTEGWIAGLQMAALAMQRSKQGDDVSAFIASFTGSHRFVIDYLTDEVLRQRPEGTKDFLLQTSILDRLSGPLCDFVAERQNSQAILEALETANLFIVPLDDDRRWYRYHHLFSDLLRQRLRQTEPGWVPVLHRRAAVWYEQHGFIPEAVSHALTASDFKGAARLIEPIGFLIMTRSEWATLMRWLNAMPRSFVRTRPWLCIFQAWMLRRAGRYDDVEKLVNDAERALNDTHSPVAPDDVQVVRAHFAALRSYIAIYNGETALALEHAHDAQELFPPGDMIRGATGLVLGIAHKMNGDLGAAHRAFAQARSMAQTSDNVFLFHIATWQMGYTQMLQGKLHQAVETYRGSLKQASAREERRVLFAGQPHVYLGDILRERNELEAATTHLMAGIELCDPTRLLDALTDGYVVLARVRLAQGDLRGALAACNDAQALLQVPSPDPRNVIQVGHCRIRLWLAQGDLASAVRWVQEIGLGLEDELNFKRELAHIILARVLLAMGRERPDAGHLDDALRLLDRLLETAEAARWVGKVIETLVLQALALCEKGDTEAAMKPLKRALSIAEPEGYVRVFVDEGAPMAVLLRAAQASKVSPGFVGRLLTAFGAGAEDPIPPSQRKLRPTISASRDDRSSMYEPLSGREIQVLQLIAAGLTNQEVAEELTIAVSTVKTHLKNIYAKLDVRNRTQAAARAQELDLLP